MNKRSRLALIAITAVAGVVRFWGISFGLPHTDARPDENFIILVARSFLAGHFTPVFYDYPWLYMWAVTLVYLGYYVWGLMTGVFHTIGDLLASWPVHWQPFFLLSRGLSATLGTATVPVVFWIGRRLWDETTGLVAALFLGFAFMHVRDSHFGTTDVAMTFLLMLAIAFLIDAQLKGRPPVAAGLVAGLAAATKYTALLLLVPIAISEVAYFTRATERRIDTSFNRLFRVGLAFLVAFLIGVPFVVIDTDRFLAAMQLLRQSTLVGQGAVPASAGWLHHLQISLPYGIRLPLLISGLAGAVGIVAVTPTIGLVLFSFPVACYAAAAIARNVFFRYTIPLIPFLCLAAAWLVCRVAAMLASKASSHRARTLQIVSAWLIAAAVIVPSASAVVGFDRIISETDNRVVLAQWFAAHVPKGSSVLQSGSRYGHAQFDGRLHYREWKWDGRSFKVDTEAATGRPDWIVIQESPLPSETQAIVKQYLRQDYVLVQQFAALSIDGGARVYDPQDAFFVPVFGFEGVKRPGPNFSVFKQAGAPIR